MERVAILLFKRPAPVAEVVVPSEDYVIEEKGLEGRKGRVERRLVGATLLPRYVHNVLVSGKLRIDLVKEGPQRSRQLGQALGGDLLDHIDVVGKVCVGHGPVDDGLGDPERPVGAGPVDEGIERGEGLLGGRTQEQHFVDHVVLAPLSSAGGLEYLQLRPDHLGSIRGRYVGRTVRVAVSDPPLAERSSQLHPAPPGGAGWSWLLRSARGGSLTATRTVRPTYRPRMLPR